MSISAAFANALTGLGAAARQAEVVSANVANAGTAGYGRRVLETSAQSVGGTGAGVHVDGVRRQVDSALLASRRLADADTAAADSHAAFHARLEEAVGIPGRGDSLSGRLAALESALIQAGSRPDSQTRLAMVADAAGALTDTFNSISRKIQNLRMDADREIAQQIGTLNDRLAMVDDLNMQIRTALSAGNDATGLMDQRQTVVDEIAGIVPLRVIPRDRGEIAIYSPTGAVLLDGRPAEFGFSQSNLIVPEMTRAGGGLSGLTLNGRAIDTAGPRSPVAGGSLAAAFAQRDEAAVSAQANLDALARNLIERFQAPGLDPSLAAGAPGLFTDDGAAFDPAKETGLSGGLALNPAADPARGGAVWRLRDGLGATSPGPVGNGALLHSLAGALTDERTAASGGFSDVRRGIGGLAGEFLSQIGHDRQMADAELGFSRTRGNALRASELEGGVDTDQEMQTLLEVERAYSANARVIQTIDDLLNNLLRI